MNIRPLTEIEIFAASLKTGPLDRPAPRLNGYPVIRAVAMRHGLATAPIQRLSQLRSLPMPDFIVSGRSIDGTVYAMRQSPSRYGWTDSKAEATRFTQAEAARVVAARQAANNVSPADSIIGHLKAKPEDSAVCRWHALDSTWHRQSGYVGINESQRLYVIPSGDGFSTLGFDYAERKRRAVLAWLGKGALNAEPGTGVAYDVYLEAMRAGAEHAAATGTRCPAELIPALVGLEGKRVLVTYPDGTESSFYVGKSTGWMPCHLEIKRRDSTGGAAVYFPDGARVRVLDGSR